jgi:hypothetical protein
MMNFVTLFKAVDAVIALREAAKGFKGLATPSRPADSVLSPRSAARGEGGPGGPIEARLTNVLVAALKEAFDRDRARLDLERIQLEEQRRRSEETLRLELRRQAADREFGRLRLLAGTAMVGWLASVVMVAVRLGAMSTPARVAIAAGWLLLLGGLASAFTAQKRLGTFVPDGDQPPDAGPAGAAALWLMIAGLAVTASSLLI